MIIVYALTENLYPYFRPTLTSLFEHNDPEKIYILAESETLPYDLPDVCEVINVSGQEHFPKDGANASTIYTYMAMMRVCYTELLPDADKVIQLDIDTIICDSLQPLWDIDLTGKWFAACPEYLTTYNPWQKEKYYNIGVCVFNLKQMREDNAMPRMIKMLNEQQLSCVEQDTLNYFAVPDKVVDIPVRYNESFCCGYTDDPAVVHYAGCRDWYRNAAIKRFNYLEKYL